MSRLSPLRTLVLGVVALALVACQPAATPSLPGATTPASPSPIFDPAASAEARAALAEALREALTAARDGEPTTEPSAPSAPAGPPKGGPGGDEDRYVARFGNCPDAERLLPDELAERGVINEAAGGNDGIERHPLVAPFFAASGAKVACHAFGTSADGSGYDAAELIVMPVESDDPDELAAEFVRVAARAINPETGDPTFGTPSEVVTVEVGGERAVVIVGSHPDIIVGEHAVVIVWTLPAALRGGETVEDGEALIEFYVELANLEARS